MNTPAEMLKPTEAAVVARVSVRDVNRVIDEGILPPALLSMKKSRLIKPAACMLISFYFESAKLLTSDERQLTIKAALPLLKKWRNLAVHDLAREDWIVRHEFLSVDLRSFANRTVEGLSQLAAAREIVVSDPEILSGTPVIRGTRIPVHDVGASVEAGISMERILSAYPSLDSTIVELASIYSRAEPLRGRPRRTNELPKGGRLISTRTVPGKRTTDEAPDR